jgi:hypothetical protein
MTHIAGGVPRRMQPGQRLRLSNIDRPAQSIEFNHEIRQRRHRKPVDIHRHQIGFQRYRPTRKTGAQKSLKGGIFWKGVC